MNKTILAIDPGDFASAYCLWTPKTKNLKSAKILNTQVVERIKSNQLVADVILIEMIASYGMAVGKEIFNTCRFIGRLEEIFESCFQKKPYLIFRKDVKLHHTGRLNTSDSDVITALKKKYGNKGTAKNPGLTYFLSDDMWQSFALATMYSERLK